MDSSLFDTINKEGSFLFYILRGCRLKWFPQALEIMEKLENHEKKVPRVELSWN